MLGCQSPIPSGQTVPYGDNFRRKGHRKEHSLRARRTYRPKQPEPVPNLVPLEQGRTESKKAFKPLIPEGNLVVEKLRSSFTVCLGIKVSTRNNL